MKLGKVGIKMNFNFITVLFLYSKKTCFAVISKLFKPYLIIETTQTERQS